MTKYILTFAVLISTALGFAIADGSGNTATPRILNVGPGKPFAVPSLAAAVARDGDTIDIAAGQYLGDVAVWRANRLTIQGTGGRAVMNAYGHIAEGKAIWVIRGRDTTVDNIEFTGAQSDDSNGAGIRQEGANLTITNCFFHDNQDGILVGDNPKSAIDIENTEFSHNGAGDGKSHNIYVNRVLEFTMKACWSHDAVVGHDVKSRAFTNYILYNRIGDDPTSTTSYQIDFPNGGNCVVLGNVLEQGPNASNNVLITYGEEKRQNPQQALYVINNTFTNHKPIGVFVRVVGAPTVRVTNNLLVGNGTLLAGTTGDVSHNLVAGKSDVTDPDFADFDLAVGSPAIDAGVDPGTDGDFSLMPTFEYVHPLGLRPRPVNGIIDIGAYEYSVPRN